MLQANTISPKLFTACIKSVFQKLNWDVKGIKIYGEYLNQLRFADVIVLITDNVEKLREILNELNDARKAVGLRVNFKKAHVMANSKIN